MQQAEKILGKRFIDNMKGDNGYLKKINDPPSTLLNYTVSPTDIPKDSEYAFQITGKKNNGYDVNITTDPSADKPLFNPKIISIKFSFTTGSDKLCVFSNSSFSEATGAKDGECSYSGPGGIFILNLITQNGESVTMIGYEYQLLPATQDNPASPSQRILSNRGAFNITATGKPITSDNVFPLRLVEERLGALCY
ncbi:hypothetical protein G7Z17_g346 [Cylindrodendrum hubeiense]|uniref:Uncharacterized protein n=1 Tax=Cylindrodendrum hubeiense TaxID=595255 RepID=A0A9P5HNP9_9HYPO|nr:hypothetical protein G7Z17_g346 [Cylindrodendrum hubeiense]